MKNTYWPLRPLVFTFVALAVVLGACSLSNDVQIDRKNFEDVVDMRQNIVLKFNKELMPDSLLNTWDTTAYLTFTPKVAGKYKWTAPDELVFSPVDAFRPSTDYTMKLNEALTHRAKEQYGVTSDAVKFHTPYLSLENVDVYWSKSAGSGAIGATARLHFNYKLNALDVGRLLHIEVDGKTTQYDLQSASVTEDVQVFIAGLNYQQTSDIPLKITIDKGLKLPESEWVSKEPMVRETIIPPPGRFAVTNVTTDYEGAKGLVYIYTTQSVDDGQDVRSLISVTPATPFETELMENGVLLRGDFSAGTTYELTVNSALRGIFNENLGSDYKQYIEFGEREPSLSFSTSKAMYLSTKSSKAVGINITSIPRIKVTVAKVYENNILAYMRQGKDYDYYYDDATDNYYWMYGFTRWENYGDVVYEREYDTRNLPSTNGVYHLSLDLPDRSSYKGVYIVKVASTDRQWLQDSRIISVSDIGLIAKATANDVVVFANSIKDVSAISGVEIKLISSNNQEILSAKTDGDGVARFENLRSRAPNFNVAMITAHSGDDFNTMLFEGTKVETSRYDVGGAQENPTGYQAFIYGERNIYRPGETVHLNTVLRDANWKPVAGVPVKMKVLLPNGKVYKAMKLTLGAQGAAESSVVLPVSAITGTYTAEVYSANDILLNSYPVSVEEFIPDRIRVTMDIDKEVMTNRDSLLVSAHAVNLFGPPAAGRNYEMQFLLRRKDFRPKGFEEYTFSVKTKNEVSLQDVVKQGKTNGEGNASEKFGVPAGLDDIGMLTGRVYVTVFDETGRPVNRLQQFDVLTQEVFYGIKEFDAYTSTRRSLSIPLIAVNKNGSPSSAKAQVQIVKYNWQNVIEKSEEGSFRYVSQKKEQIMVDRVVPVSGTSTNFSYMPMASGEYEIRVKRPGVENYVSYTFYAYGWGDTQSSSFEVNTEGQVTIEFDKPVYKVGEMANILFKTPFAGRLLVTVERNKLYEHFVIETDKKSATLALSVKEDYLPNVYISATLIKPLDDNTVPLTVAHGFAPLRVEDPSTRLPVSISAPSNSRSKTKQKITVRTGGKSDVELTIAVVDEGILQLKDFQTPDPHGFFFRKRALQVESYNIYPYLFPELSRKISSTGGDGFDLQKRINPMTNRRVNLVSFWSGIVKSNGSGEASITIDIPQFSGDLRIMAVAYKDKMFGSADAHIKVADPVVVSSALPRFLSPGDTVNMPVTLTNTTERQGSASATVKTSGGLMVIGGATQSAELPAGREAQVLFRIAASPSIGTGEVEVSVSGLGGTFTDKTSLTIRPASSLLKTTGSGDVNAGAQKSVSLQHNFIPASVAGRLVVSKTPIAQFSEDLTYLQQYPYGCVEQTVSSVFPQLYIADLSKALREKPVRNDITQDNVQGAIRRLATMQLYNGALSYWPGGTEESWWGTVYAAHFVFEAGRAGYDIQEQQLDRMFDYLVKKVRSRPRETYRYYDNQNRLVTIDIPSKDVFYSLYVLALAGRHDIATMNYYKARTDSMALDSKYLLAGAYLLAGDRKSYVSILPKAFSGERSVRSLGGNFYSYIRDEAIALNAILEADPDNPQVASMAKHLSEQLKANKWLSTQERAFALLALGKIARRANTSKVTATVSAGGKTLGTMNDNDLVLTNTGIGQTVNIKAEGTGKVYYFWEIEGISSTGEYREEDNYLRVRKTFLTRSGQPVSGRSFKQNDLIVVRLSVASSNGEKVENVVVTDLLPAGFEIENPRIGAVPELGWIKDNASPDYFDIRDDRINYFTTVEGKERHFYYLVRAVTRGSFRMGPVSADAMYNADYHSANGAGTIWVQQ